MSDFNGAGELANFLKTNFEQLLQAFVLGLTGMTVGVAKLLQSGDNISRRQLIGDVIISGSLGVAAGGALAFVPVLPLVAQMGLAAAFANIGLVGIKALVGKLTGNQVDINDDTKKP